MAKKDSLTLTIRLHDPKEKKDAKLRADWSVQEIPREDLAMPIEEFVKRYMLPAFLGLEQVKQPQSAASAAATASPTLPVETAAPSDPTAADASAQAKP